MLNNDEESMTLLKVENKELREKNKGLADQVVELQRQVDFQVQNLVVVNERLGAARSHADKLRAEVEVHEDFVDLLLNKLINKGK